ncbi:hypothetical protein [Paremcibacter congregatus]|uniref:hypothetical protein n=1 Tax=Paremcibacter congregatus TaxID=2043170 RepID=UPI0030EC5353|tara:strand:+ start:1136 stop:1429 length:294 start_codon:yes stop_codon:yes gene_type:complete
MNPQVTKSSYESSTSTDEEYSFLELVAEMRALDMDPQPILKTAAHDIWQRYGNEVLAYTKTMLDQMILIKNKNGIYLWGELHNILASQICPDYITIH